MSKIVVLTYVLRILGTIFVLLYFFGEGLFYNLFPGLEGMSLICFLFRHCFYLWVQAFIT